jgi:hypothetical protein
MHETTWEPQTDFHEMSYWLIPPPKKLLSNSNSHLDSMILKTYMQFHTNLDDNSLKCIPNKMLQSEVGLHVLLTVAVLTPQSLADNGDLFLYVYEILAFSFQATVVCSLK